MKKIIWAVAFIALVMNTLPTAPGMEVFAQAGRSPAGGVPIFQVDPSWIKLPNGWVIGQVAAVAIDAPIGKGHVVMFANRPFWRWQTQGNFFLGFNAILNWNDLGAGRTPPRTQTTTAGADGKW